MKPVKLAVIGTGLIGIKHAELINANNNCHLVGTCDVDVGRRTVAEKFNVPFYRDLEVLLDREKPEGVIIATPKGLHSSNAEVCARRSVHVLIEKPIADTLEEAHRIVRVTDETGIHVLIGHHRRHVPVDIPVS